MDNSRCCGPACVLLASLTVPHHFVLGVLEMFRTGLRPADFSAAKLGALGLAAVLVLGGCSGSGNDSGAEAAEGVSSKAVPSTSGGEATASTTASPTPTTPTANPPTAAYKPATAKGPAENVRLPVMPELARQESGEGLREFARYWYALLNYSFETGDVNSVKHVSGPDCVLCKRAYEMLDIGYEDRDWILGGKFVVHGTQSNFVLTSKSQYQVLVHLEQAPLEYRGPGDVVYETDEGLDSDSVHMLEATYGDGGWFANNVVIIK